MLTVPVVYNVSIVPSAWSLTGMRGANTGRVHFDGLAVQDFDRIGRPGDYLRYLAFSASA